MLSQSSISSKGRTGGWAKSFLGAVHREQPVGAARDNTEFAEARASKPQDVPGTK